jgi:hypothetical protein
MLDTETRKHQWQWVYQQQVVLDFMHCLEKKEIVHLIGPMMQHRLSDVHLNHILNPLHAFLFVDGGVRIKKDMQGLGLKPEQCLSLGDGDSAELALDLMLPPDKDYTDLTVALAILGRWNAAKKIIKAWGFYGGRLDHQLVVMGNFSHWLEQRNGDCRIELFTSLQDDTPSHICLPAGTHHLSIHGVFSLISLLPNEIQITGSCLYQLKKPIAVKPMSDLGLSNKGHGMIQIICHSPLWLMQQHATGNVL